MYDQCPYEPCLYAYITSSSSAWFDVPFSFFLLYHSFLHQCKYFFPPTDWKSSNWLYLFFDCTSANCSFYSHGLGRNCLRFYQSFPLLCDEVWVNIHLLLLWKHHLELFQILFHFLQPWGSWLRVWSEIRERHQDGGGKDMPRDCQGKRHLFILLWRFPPVLFVLPVGNLSRLGAIQGSVSLPLWAALWAPQKGGPLSWLGVQGLWIEREAERPVVTSCPDSSWGWTCYVGMGIEGRWLGPPHYGVHLDPFSS